MRHAEPRFAWASAASSFAARPGDAGMLMSVIFFCGDENKNKKELRRPVFLLKVILYV